MLDTRTLSVPERGTLGHTPERPVAGGFLPEFVDLDAHRVADRGQHVAVRNRIRSIVHVLAGPEVATTAAQNHHRNVGGRVTGSRAHLAGPEHDRIVERPAPLACGNTSTLARGPGAESSPGSVTGTRIGGAAVDRSARDGPLDPALELQMRTVVLRCDLDRLEEQVTIGQRRQTKTPDAGSASARVAARPLAPKDPLAQVKHSPVLDGNVMKVLPIDRAAKPRPVRRDDELADGSGIGTPVEAPCNEGCRRGEEATFFQRARVPV